MSNWTAPPAVEGKWPPLHDAICRAIWHDDLSELQIILADGADVTEIADSHASTDTTVLHTAVGGTVDLLDLLLNHGATDFLEAKCGPGEEARWSGHTPLQMAAKVGCRATALRLIDAGAEYDLFSAVALGDMERVAELVDKDETLLTKGDDYQASLLHWAAVQDQHEMATYLIQRGVSIDGLDDFSETPLLVASERQAAHRALIQLGRARRIFLHLESIVDLLLEHGANVDVFAAAALGNDSVLGKLLESDATLAGSTNGYGATPLHWAARNAHIESAELLLHHGADIDAKDCIGCPPLWYAAYCCNNSAMTQFLCSHGADVDFRNVWGKGIEDYDCGYGCYSIIESHRK